LRRSVAQLSPQQLWWRPNQNSNSVGNLLMHLEGNVREWIIAGLGSQPYHRRRDQEFAQRKAIPADRLMQSLEQTVEEAIQVMERLETPSLLEKRPIQVDQVTGLEAIFHVVEHFSYHTGQILYITKSVKDVDLNFHDL
ncbi:MAG: DinB family protein, partial [Acidobacteriota bacterium]